MTDHLLQEVNHALRADRALTLWSRYRPVILALVVALILGTAAHSGWDYYRQVRGEKTMQALSNHQALLVAGQAKAAAEGFGAIAAAQRGALRDRLSRRLAATNPLQAHDAAPGCVAWGCASRLVAVSASGASRQAGVGR